MPRVDGNTTSHNSQGGYGLPSLKALYKHHYHYSDDNVIDLVLGIIAGNLLDSDPVWIHLISPPSGGKTELLYSVKNCEETFFLSEFTAQSLISGYREPPSLSSSKDDEDVDASEDSNGKRIKYNKDRDYSLLPHLNGKVLITKDFSVIHGKPPETREQILSILRDAYDGSSSRAFGNSDVKSFTSRFNYITGMTPEIEKLWSLNTLGERFLLYRINIENRREHAKKALDNMESDEGSLSVRNELQVAVKQFMDTVNRKKPRTSNSMRDLIIDLAEILATCRTYVHRERNDDIITIPLAEVPTRVAKQLMRIGQSVAMVRGKEEVTEDEFILMRRVCFDSLPTNRRLLLTALCETMDKESPLDLFSERLNRISTRTVERELNNLAELGVVVKNKRQVTIQGKSLKTTKIFYKLSKQFQDYCNRVGVIPPLISAGSGIE